MQPSADDLCNSSAVELVRLMRQKQVSSRDVMAAHLAQIERVNPKVNAIVTLVAEQAMAEAARADESLARGGAVGVLHGLPVAHKDLVDTAGIRTTRGSPSIATTCRRATRSSSRGFARRARSRWARRTRRSSAPGRRRSTRSSARPAIPTTSPRRAAAAAAAPRWRWPAGWCPSPTAATPAARCATRRRSATSSASGRRRAACRGSPASWSPLSVSGPMARSVGDVALFLSAIAGPDPRNPLSHRGGRRALSARRLAAVSRTCAWHGGADSGGIPFEPEIRRGRRPAAADLRGSRLPASRRPNRTSRASTRRFRRCATPQITRSTRRWCASGPTG